MTASDVFLTLRRDRAQAGTLVEQIVDGIRRAVTERRLVAGTPLPSVREAALAQGVSTFTVAEAYQRLVSLGIITSRRGARYRVRRPEATKETISPVWAPPQLDADWLLSEVYADRSVPIKAGCGWLPGEWVIEPGMRAALRSTSRVPREQFGDYDHPFGHAPLRGHVAEQLQRHGLNVSGDQVLLTHGATQGLDLVVRLLLQPGDTVLVEDPCYCNLLPIFQLAKVRPIGVARTRDGLDIEAFEAAIRSHRPKAIFLTPVLQNPTGSTMRMDAAFRILQVAERAGLWIVEDDVNRELGPAGAPMLAAMEGLRRVIYLGGFSKTISPALRVGYLVAEKSVLTELARIKMATGLTSSSVAERIVLRVLTEGHYHRHVVQIRDRLAAAHELAAARLREAGADLFEAPGAGLFLWARLPIDADDATVVTKAALGHGVWLAPGAYFSARGGTSPWFRFNVAFCDSPILWTFLKGLRAS